MNGRIYWLGDVWRRTFAQDDVVVEITLATAPNPAQRRALEAAAERYGAFLGRPVTLVKR